MNSNGSRNGVELSYLIMVKQMLEGYVHFLPGIFIVISLILRGAVTVDMYAALSSGQILLIVFAYVIFMPQIEIHHLFSKNYQNVCRNARHRR